MESSSSSLLSLLTPSSPFLHNNQTTKTKTTLQIHFNQTYSPPRIQFSRRIVPTPDSLVTPSSQNWARSKPGILIGNYYRDNLNLDGDDVDDIDDDEEEEEEEDRSLDLFVRFLENVFKKISRKARKAVRSVLPVNISAKLVRFSVNGALTLTFLWVLKAFLEVVCTLGSVMFISILVIRGVWTGLSHLQDNRYYRRDGIDDLTWSGTRPAA